MKNQAFTIYCVNSFVLYIINIHLTRLCTGEGMRFLVNDCLVSSQTGLFFSHITSINVERSSIIWSYGHSLLHPFTRLWLYDSVWETEQGKILNVIYIEPYSDFVWKKMKYSCCTKQATTTRNHTICSTCHYKTCPLL